MINNVNAVNSDYINTVQTAQTESTTKVDEKEDLEQSVYKQATIEDTIELSESGKGLSESSLRSIQNSIQQNTLSLLKNFVNASNSTYQSGLSAEDSATLIDAYNTSRYLAKNAFKMYYSNQSDSSEISDLKKQIQSLEEEISSMEDEDSEE